MIRALALTCLWAAAAQADPAAWRVTTPEGGELWLLGSVHYLRELDHPLPPLVDRLYAQADVLVMELDLDDLDPLQSQAHFLAAAMLPPGRTLPEVLGPDVYSHAAERAAAFGVDLRLLDRFEPWLVAVTMLELGMVQLGYRAERGIEQYLLGKAAADGKPILGLESLETQIAVFDGLSTPDQRALLEQTLGELDGAEAAMAKMIAAWRNGELDALADTLMQEFGSFPALYDALIVKRNLRWLDSLAVFLEDPRPHLVVVGALHLVGPDSVIDSLSARGFRVEVVE